MLLGQNGLDKLKSSHIAIFGIGGVGSYVAEALARSGVGKLTLTDHDTVSVSNINRQLIALNSTIGKSKVQVMKERIFDINEDAEVFINEKFYLPENRDEFDFSEFDYIIDAVDTVSAKLDIIERAYNMGIPCISSMGAGNKLRPELFEISDIYKTSVCPLARVMRRELKKRGVMNLNVVYSKEEPIIPDNVQTGKKPTPGSIAFVQSVAGLIIAGHVIREISEKE